MKILITGIPGTGKTTVLAELQKHGRVVIDLDATGICRWKNKETEEFTEYGIDGRDYEWLTKHSWYCDISILRKLLSCIRKDKDVFIAGIAENIEELVNEFDKVFILNADDNVVKQRLNTRSNNHFAKRESEQNFIFEHGKQLLKKLKNFSEVNANHSPVKITEFILNDLKIDK